MNRCRVLFIITVLIATGWVQWSFWNSMESGARQPARALLTRRPETSSSDLPQKTPKANAGDRFKFEHEGQTVTVDLAQARRSHQLLIRQPPSSRDIKSAAAPDPDFNFLSWPGRELRGEETIKTRKCWVIDFTNPNHAGPHFLVRLYVDQKLGALMRIHAYDWSSKLVLGYTVTTGKKVNGALTVRTAEALHYQPGTRRIVQEVEYRLP